MMSIQCALSTWQDETTTRSGKQHQVADRFLITQDLDFSDVRRFTPGTHAGLLLVRLGQPGRNVLTARVEMLFATEHVDRWRGCLVVATDHKVRIKRPV
jgi:hypothetical protein